MQSVPRKQQGLRVLECAIYRGPHLFGPLPMVRLQLDIGALEYRPSNRLPGFVDALIAALPGLEKHGCSLGYDGGFVERLREGTWIGHIVEHVALELQACVGAKVSRGKTRSVDGRPGVYDVVYQYRDEAVGLLAGRLALDLVDALLPPDIEPTQGAEQICAIESGVERASVEAKIALLKRAQSAHALGPTACALVEEAERRGIPVLRLDDHSLLQFGWGAKQARMRASITSRTPFIAVEAACDKELTKRLLREAGLPTPDGAVVESAEQAVREAQTLGWPVAVKPLDGNHGRGVSIELGDADAVREAFARAAECAPKVIVERHLHGDDYRVLVIDGEVAAAARRDPACVVGDGVSTVAALIEALNADPRRGDGHEQAMTKLRCDAQLEAYLAKRGLALDSVPVAGEIVRLCGAANMSAGGAATDVTDEVHPDNAAIAVRAAQTLGLDIAGVDLVLPDIARSAHETGGGIVEINAAPGFRMHLAPARGRPRNVAKPTMNMLFGRDGDGRIPVFAVTGTNGKSTVVRMLAHILRQSDKCVGMTTTGGVYIDRERILKLDASGPRSARTVLADSSVEAAVLEIARGGLLREGLPFDRCAVGCVTNIQGDHLGEKGVATLDDLARVKGLVVQNVSPDGVSVLNADDGRCAAMAERARGRIAYFSMHGGVNMGDLLRLHTAQDGLAVVYDPGYDAIVLHNEGRRRILLRAADIPATVGGLARFNIENAMAAACMALGAGVAAEHVTQALSTFGGAFEQNPGRLNIFDGHGFRVIVDYAHNVAGLLAVGELLQRMRPAYGRQLGMVAAPGDRRDADIVSMGEVAALTFDEIVFREDADPRGRAPGEVMALLVHGAQRAGMAPDRLHQVGDELEATTFCLRLARPGDLVLLTATDVERVWAHMLAYRPTLSQAASVESASASRRRSGENGRPHA